MSPDAFATRYGPWALVAGAAVGLGAGMRDRQLTVYAATEAFALVFADALWVELMSEITANLIPTGRTA